MTPVRIAVAALLLCDIGMAQNAFEVASVKPADPKAPHVQWLMYPGGRLVVTNHTLTMLIEAAYDGSLYRITGGPRWVDSDLYSITAKAPAGSAAARFLPDTPQVAPPPEFRAMLQTLLADRFGLKIHRERRELPVLALVIAKGGPKLEPAHDTSAAPQWSIGRGKIEAHNRDIAWLIAVLERHFERTIVDRTGLTGGYDFVMEFDPEQRDDADSARPSFTTALRTQLGLKREATKGAVQVLVIDDARRPGAN